MDMFTYALAKKAGGSGGSVTVPTKVSELENDLGFLTPPMVTKFFTTAGTETVSGESGYIGGIDAHILLREATQDDYERIVGLASGTADCYLGDESVELIRAAAEGNYMLVYNVKEAAGDASMGMDIDDATKHVYGIITYEGEESSTGYVLMLFSDVSVTHDWNVISRGEYQKALLFDRTPTEGSGNPVKSGGIKSAMDAAITAAITDAFSGITSFSFYICGNGEYDSQTLLPTVSNPDRQHIYLVPDSGTYKEYLWISSTTYEMIGTTDIDLTGYVTTAQLTTALGGKSDTGHTHDDRYYTETEMDTALAGKSDTGHTHDSRYYTETEVDTALAGKSDTGHTHAYSAITGKPTNLITGQDKSGTDTAFTIKLSTTAPAVGTPATQITLVGASL